MSFFKPFFDDEKKLKEKKNTKKSKTKLTAPHVSHLPVVLLPAQHLRRDVRGGSHGRFRLRVEQRGLAVAEVADLEPRGRSPVQQRVLELEVAVADPLGVAAPHPAHQLLEEEPSLVLGEAACFHNPVEQLSAAGVFHHDPQVRGREEDLLEADDVGVEQRAVVDQLALDVAVDLLGVVWWGMEGKRESCEVSKFLSKGPAFFFFLFSLSLSRLLLFFFLSLPCPRAR